MVLLIFVRERGAEAEVSSKQLIASVGRCVPRPEWLTSPLPLLIEQ